MDEFDKSDREEHFSKVVRAGKRTYFFDVKTTRKNDYYLTITESKKKTLDDGQVQYEKHKIYLYKEDFAKFSEGFEEALDFIKECMGDSFNDIEEHADHSGRFSDVDFDDLEK